MINIQLTDAEATALKDILTSYASDLRMEIADTDKYEFREGLKKKETFLNDLLGRLSGKN